MLYNFTIIYPPHLAYTFPIHLTSWTPELTLISPHYSISANKNFCPIYKLTVPKDIYGCSSYNPNEFMLDQQYNSYPDKVDFENV